MAIYRDSSARHNAYSKCDECEAEGLTDVVTWKSKRTFGWLDDHRGIVLCPSCAVAVGAMLIGDAREASVAFRQAALQRPEEVADPSLVTRRLRESEDDLVMD